MYIYETDHIHSFFFDLLIVYDCKNHYIQSEIVILRWLLSETSKIMVISPTYTPILNFMRGVVWHRISIVIVSGRAIAKIAGYLA